ncbi:AT-rich interactive domain-containing protein 3A [Polyrhizophydium stewartii]|uniref:AT-rich interactive domain-containing protein 3A n=1 Tax=Polyrhizophydium stewartii TaxID=2732419 RepID=A0ABR4N4W5_9FUNG
MLGDLSFQMPQLAADYRADAAAHAPHDAPRQQPRMAAVSAGHGGVFAGCQPVASNSAVSDAAMPTAAAASAAHAAGGALLAARGGASSTQHSQARGDRAPHFKLKARSLKLTPLAMPSSHLTRAAHDTQLSGDTHAHLAYGPHTALMSAGLADDVFGGRVAAPLAGYESGSMSAVELHPTHAAFAPLASAAASPALHAELRQSDAVCMSGTAVGSASPLAAAAPLRAARGPTPQVALHRIATHQQAIMQQQQHHHHQQQQATLCLSTQETAHLLGDQSPLSADPLSAGPLSSPWSSCSPYSLNSPGGFPSLPRGPVTMIQSTTVRNQYGQPMVSPAATMSSGHGSPIATTASAVSALHVCRRPKYIPRKPSMLTQDAPYPRGGTDALPDAASPNHSGGGAFRDDVDQSASLMRGLNLFERRQNPYLRPSVDSLRPARSSIQLPARGSPSRFDQTPARAEPERPHSAPFLHQHEPLAMLSAPSADAGKLDCDVDLEFPDAAQILALQQMASGDLVDMAGVFGFAKDEQAAASDVMQGVVADSASSAQAPQASLESSSSSGSAASARPSGGRRRSRKAPAAERLMSSDPDYYGFTTESSRSTKAEDFNREILAMLQRAGKRVVKLPSIDRKTLSFWALYHAVLELGGSSHVTRMRKWKRVATILKLPSTLTSSSFTLRTYFEHFLSEYERQALTGHVLPAGMHSMHDEHLVTTHHTGLVYHGRSAEHALEDMPAMPFDLLGRHLSGPSLVADALLGVSQSLGPGTGLSTAVSSPNYMHSASTSTNISAQSTPHARNGGDNGGDNSGCGAAAVGGGLIMPVLDADFHLMSALSDMSGSAAAMSMSHGSALSVQTTPSPSSTAGFVGADTKLDMGGPLCDYLVGIEDWPAGMAGMASTTAMATAAAAAAAASSDGFSGAQSGIFAHSGLLMPPLIQNAT